MIVTNAVEFDRRGICDGPVLPSRLETSCVGVAPGLAQAPDEQRIVLLTAAERAHDASEFAFAADYAVQLTLFGELCERQAAVHLLRSVRVQRFAPGTVAAVVRAGAEVDRVDGDQIAVPLHEAAGDDRDITVGGHGAAW